MDGAKAFILPAVAAAVLLGYYAWSSMSDPEPAAEGAPAPATKAKAPEVEPSAEAEPEPPPTPEQARRPTPPDLGAAAPEAPPSRPSAEGPSREELRRRIEQAQRSRLGGGRDGEPLDREALGALQPEYIQARIREDLVPLATECYEMALERDESLAGRMVLRFVIAGEPDVGGIVEEAELTPDSDLREVELAECMRESMMSVTFEPPTDGGTVEVNYPFVFEPSED